MLDWLKRLISPTPTVPTVPTALTAPPIAPRERLQPEAGFVVTIDDKRVVCMRPTGEEESVAWTDLDAVIVETNDSGPAGADVWWILFGRNGSSGCAIPQGATGEGPLLDALQALPDFDNEQLIAAMGCTDNREFLCWKRPAAPDAGV